MIALTGHTSGIGAAIVARYGDEVRGFSRSNGYDIGQQSDRRRIVDDSSDCDIFINNAFSGIAQVELLYAIWDAWKDSDRLIINISSNSPDGIKKQSHPYAAFKSALDKASEQLSYQSAKVRVCNLRPGWIDTHRAANEPGSKISTKDLVDVIDMIIDAPPSLRFTSLTVLPR